MPHFEIHASDVEAAKAFYSGLFGWDFSPMEGGEEMAYHLIEGDQTSVTPGRWTMAVPRRCRPKITPASVAVPM